MPRYRSAVYFGFLGNNSGNVQRFFICLKYLVVRNIHLWILYISTVYLMIFLSQKLKRRAASQYIHTYTGCKMFWIMKIKTIRFLMFLEEVSSSYQGCNYLIKTTVKYMLTLLLQFQILLQIKIITLFSVNMLKCNLLLWSKLNLLIIINPVFSVTWSFINHSNMLICCVRNISDY